MLEALRDPLWQFVGAIVAVFSIFVALSVHRLQVKIHELAIGLVFSRPLLSVADELTSHVKIELDGREVKNLHLLVFGVKNSGRQAITASDFERPLSISFANGEVVSASIASQSPENMGAIVKSSESRVELMPLLLNPEDQVLVQVLLSAISVVPSIDARVMNIQKYVPINTKQKLPPYFQSAAPYTVFLLLIFAAFLFIFSGRDSDGFYLAVWFIGTAVLSSMFSFILRLRERVGVSARRCIKDEGE